MSIHVTILSSYILTILAFKCKRMMTTRRPEKLNIPSTLLFSRIQNAINFRFFLSKNKHCKLAIFGELHSTAEMGREIV